MIGLLLFHLNTRNNMGGKLRSIQDQVKFSEYYLEKYKFISTQFPDAKVYSNWNEFTAKSVNNQYDGIEFIHGYRSLYVSSYCEREFLHNGKSEKIKIYSSPRMNRLAYVGFNKPVSKVATGEKLERVIKFGRFSINLKNNNFKEDIFNECRVELLKFIKNNPGYKLDTKHLEPRLKKLLLFT